MMFDSEASNAPQQSWRKRWYEIIFEADTRAGKLFDVGLLIAIILSVAVVMLESVEDIRMVHGRQFLVAEWFFTALFTVEYVMRLICAPQPVRYARSFFGIVDLLAILPTYFMVLFPGAHCLTVIRAFRLLRAFRIFKLAHMLHEATAWRRAIWASRSKIAVLLTFVVIVVVIFGSAMHSIEGPESCHVGKTNYSGARTDSATGFGGF